MSKTLLFVCTVLLALFSILLIAPCFTEWYEKATPPNIAYTFGVEMGVALSALWCLLLYAWIKFKT